MGDKLGDITLTNGPGVYCCTMLDRQGRDRQGLRKCPEGHVDCGLHSTLSSPGDGEDLQRLCAGCHWLTQSSLEFSEP